MTSDSSESFEVGDAVQLKSGGPKMTVSGPDEGHGYHCIWFAGSKRESARFDPLVLSRVEDKEGK